MMLAKSIKDIFTNQASYLGINPDYIYCYSIDPNMQSVDVLLILIKEVDDTPTDYGSNRSVDLRAEVQVQIFYPRSYEEDTSILRNKIRGLLEDQQWYCDMDDGIQQDPDVGILMNTARWVKTYKK